MTNLFIVGDTYSQRDIYNIIDVSKGKEGGNWNTDILLNKSMFL